MKRSLSLLYEVCFIILSAVLAYTFLVKVADIEIFKLKLLKIPFLDLDWVPFLTYAIPLSELLVVLMMWVEKTRKQGIYGSFFLMSVFTTYLVYLHVVSPITPCSCGGIFELLSFNQHLVLNFILLAFAAFLSLTKYSPPEKKAKIQDIASA